MPNAYEQLCEESAVAALNPSRASSNNNNNDNNSNNTSNNNNDNNNYNNNSNNNNSNNNNNDNNNQRPSTPSMASNDNKLLVPELLLRMGSRVTLTTEHDLGRLLTLTTETWQFDEDAYTIGILALYRKRFPEALPEVLLALCAPILQVAICLLAMSAVAGSLDSSQTPPVGLRWAHFLCVGLCLMQLTDEAVEGCHKLIFSMRWLSGIYFPLACPWSATLAVMLGTLQFALGITTCSVCILVILSADTILETFFNYVALAFIADVDNILVRSRLIRSMIHCDCQVVAPWTPDHDHLKSLPAIVVSNTVIIMMVALFVGVDAVSNRLPGFQSVAQEMPRALLLGACVNAGLVLAVRHSAMAWAVTLISFSVYVANFSLTLLAGEDGFCGYLSSMENSILLGFSMLTLPAACSTIPRCFFDMNLIPFQVILVVIGMLMWTHQFFVRKCA